VLGFFSNIKYSKLIIKSDSASWVLDEIKKELELTFLNKLNIVNQKYIRFFKTQCIFFLNKYDLLNYNLKNNKIGISIFHFDKKQSNQNKKIINLLKSNINIKAIQITNNNMFNYLIKNEINRKKIFKIPIGINIKDFIFTKSKKKLEIKKKFKLEKFLVIGSFQKDGVGWGDGMVPKKIKGPDTFIKIVQQIAKKQKVHVILSGPSRGYVKKKLENLNISFSHYFHKDYKKLINLYSLIDIYIVSSRVEGGPRSILESMASGAIIFSTRVGQAEEIIKDNKNGFLYDEREIKLISKKIIKIYNNSYQRNKILQNARKTSLKYSYLKTRRKWISFFKAIRS